MDTAMRNIWNMVPKRLETTHINGIYCGPYNVMVSALFSRVSTPYSNLDSILETHLASMDE